MDRQQTALRPGNRLLTAIVVQGLNNRYSKENRADDDTY